MKNTLRRVPAAWLFAAQMLVCHPAVWAQLAAPRADGKSESEVTEERSIARRRVLIRQRTVVRRAPSITRNDVEFESARKERLEAKTAELITQLEQLSKREGQSSRAGELRMRLSELYFERAQAMAARESEAWEEETKRWDANPQGAQRPVLRTPRADQYRAQALGLYQELERESRGGDQGRSRMIHRDEVLFFFASTLNDMGRGKAALPHFEELVAKYPSSPRVFAARLALADLYFEGAQFAKAIPHYLRIAAGEGAPQGAEKEVANLRSYSLYKLAWCYINTGAYSKAVLAFQRTLEASREGSSEQRVAFEKEALNDLARAFALAGQYNEGERWFAGQDPALLEAFRRNVADVASDRGQWDVALVAIGKALEANPQGPSARDLALQRVRIFEKKNGLAAYAAAWAQFARDYGTGSSWLNAQSLPDADKKALVDEVVGDIRREAKNDHRAAQRRDKIELYRQAAVFYEAYFKAVPEPNPDTPDNLAEMRFYYAELLFKLKRYAEAARYYAAVGAEGKYASMASYARVAALREASRADKSLAGELSAATEDFLRNHPQDERAGDMLYASAFQSYQAGAFDAALAPLRDVVQRFPDKKQGVEAAEGVLSIFEKRGDLKGAVAEADALLANPKLAAAGGAEFTRRTRDYRNRALFKQYETAPEASADEQLAKARGFGELAGQLTGELREKALNNGVVYAHKGGDAKLESELQDRLLREFPASRFAKDAYFEKAEQMAGEGRWSEALAQYAGFLKFHGAEKGPAVESAAWNRVYIQSRLEGFWEPRLKPERDLSPALLAEARAHLERYPRSKNRAELLALLAFRPGAKPAAFAKLPALNADEKAVLDEAQVVARARAGNARDLAALVKSRPPAEAKSELLKEALAAARFAVAEPGFAAYSKRKLDYNARRFAASLKEKAAWVERLERDYLNVVAYGNAEYALKSLERLSRLYRGLAADIGKAPAAKEELAPFTKPLDEKGLGFLRTCLDKATEFRITGAGVAACRQAATDAGIYKDYLTQEIAAEPRWVPQGASARPLLRAMGAALGAGRYGEFFLALTLLNKQALTPVEAAELNNLSGLASAKLGQNQAAVRIFRKVSDMEGADLAALRSAALKNLAALYVQVRDWRQADDTLATLQADDADVAWLRGLSLVGQNKPAEAVIALDAGLARQPANMTLVFNKALAAEKAGQLDAAIQALSRYVETETPTGSHVSRALLREWKGRSK